MTAKALVTGGAGFIGSHLVDRLVDDEWEVLVIDDLSTGHLDRLRSARELGRVHFHQLDITTPTMAEVVGKFRPDVVFHLAAQAGVRPSVEDPVFDANVNILGTLNVLVAAQSAGAQRIVFASSGGAIYGEVTDAATESHEMVPEAPYGISKKVVEDYFQYFRAVHGLDYVLLCLANVYGPRQDAAGEAGVVAIFTKQMLEGRPPTINGDGTQERDYTFVADVVDAFVRAAEIGGGVRLNIGTGVATSVNDLAALLTAATGFGGVPAHGPAKAGDLQRSVVDPGRAAAHLGWKPWTDLEAGIAATVDFFRS